MNETAWVVAEFNQRRRLAKLGFTQPLSELDSFRAEAFLIISDEIDDFERKRQEQESQKRKSRR